MQSYQESFQKDNPVAEVGEDAPVEDVPEESIQSDADGSFRETIKRRAIVMEIGGFRPPADPKTSWFGKVGFGLPDEEWPMTDDDRPLAPLAQINVTELPFRPPRLGDVEFLTVFIDTEEFDADEPNGSIWCVRAYPSLDRLVPLEIPENIESEIKALPIRPKVIEEDYPVYDDIAENIPEDVADSYHDDFENVPGFKLGGWPTLIQSQIDWTSTGENSAEPEFVFQIDSTEKGRWSWGDGGVGYFGRGTAPGHDKEWFLAWQCL